MFGSARRIKPRAVAFDVIGTLFPLEPLRPAIAALGLPPAGLELWYATAARDALTLTLTDAYRPFAACLEQALSTILAEQRRPEPEGAAKALTERLATLPARPGAALAFATLRREGVAVVALTNGSEATTRTMLEGAGLADLVDHIVSTDAVKRAKPAREPYHAAAKAAGVEPHETALVAAHPWDIQGAGTAGLVTAYLSADRPFGALMRTPTMEADTLAALAELLVAA